MALLDLINKYKEDGNELRLTIILEAANKKATAKNIKALKLLILDDDASSLAMFLGDKSAIEDMQAAAVQKQIEIESKRPTHQTDLEDFAKRQLGDPKDPNAVGNRILSYQLTNWSMKTHIYPDVLFKKWCQIANKDYIELDYAPTAWTSPPTYECCILGTKVLSRDRNTRVN